MYKYEFTDICVESKGHYDSCAERGREEVF